MKKGISLITLVIMIVVISIIASSVIISLSNTNIVDQATDATFKDAVSKIQEKIEMERLNEILKKDFSYDGIVPEKYSDVLKITDDGILAYVGDDSTQSSLAKGMGVKVVEQEDNIHFSKLREIENFAKSYEASRAQYTTNVLITQYIRNNRYSGLAWDGMGGEVDTNFVAYVNENKTQTLFGTNDTFKDPVTGCDIDFVHQIATMNVYFYDEPDIFDAYAGWAGDLCTVLKQVYEYNVDNESCTKDEMVAYAKSLIGSTEGNSTMDMSDLIADVDAANISDLMTEDSSLSDTMFSYYYGEGDNTCHNRFALFKAHLEKIYESDYIRKRDNQEKIYAVAIDFLGGRGCNLVFSQAYANYIIGTSGNITENMKNATAEAFLQYMNEQI